MKSFFVSFLVIFNLFFIYGSVTANMDDKEILAKTVYAEARGEPVEGQIWVTWVIKNRAFANKSYWGGKNIGDVCRKPLQFSCWNGKTDIVINDIPTYNKIKKLTDSLFDAPASADPTQGCNQYHSKHMNPFPSWVKKCKKIRTIGNHIFYKAPL